MMRVRFRYDTVEVKKRKRRSAMPHNYIYQNASYFLTGRRGGPNYFQPKMGIYQYVHARQGDSFTVVAFGSRFVFKNVPHL